MSKSLEMPVVGPEKKEKEMPIVLLNVFEKYVEDITGENGLLNRYVDLLQSGVPYWREKYNKEKLLITLKLAEDFLRNHEDDFELLSRVNEFLDLNKNYKLAPGDILLALGELGYSDKIKALESEKINSSAEDIKTKRRSA